MINSPPHPSQDKAEFLRVSDKQIIFESVLQCLEQIETSLLQRLEPLAREFIESQLAIKLNAGVEMAKPILALDHCSLDDQWFECDRPFTYRTTTYKHLLIFTGEDGKKYQLPFQVSAVFMMEISSDNHFVIRTRTHITPRNTVQEKNYLDIEDGNGNNLKRIFANYLENGMWELPIFKFLLDYKPETAVVHQIL